MLHGLIFPTKDYWCIKCGKLTLLPGTCDGCRLGDDARTWAEKQQQPPKLKRMRGAGDQAGE